MDIKEKRSKAMNAVAQARSIHKKAEDEKRDMLPEEVKQFDEYMSEYDRLDAEIRKYEKDCEDKGRRNDKLKDAERNMSATQQAVAGRQNLDSGEERTHPRDTEEYRTAFKKFIKSGSVALTAAEHRALQADSDTLAGYVVTPQQFVVKLIQSVDDAVFVRKLATTFKLNKSESIGVPSLDTDVSDADWTSELATGSEDSSVAFGKRELRPYPVAKRIKISNKLINSGAFDVEAFIRSRLAYKFGVTQEKAFLTGNGSQQPLGVMTASTNGIPTSRDVSTGNTTTSIQTDGLIEAKFSVKGQYWPRLSWAFHRDAVKQIRKLKDANGQYIWQPGISQSIPDRILEVPYFMSEYMPNTFTTGLYVGIIGDFSFYWIADALDMALQRLVELYAETNQIGYIGRLETDGMPVLGEAFARVKLA